MTDTLQRRMDADSRNGTFEVDPNHAAYGVRYCELCGAEVDKHGECNDSVADSEVELAVKAVEALTRWAIYDRNMMLVLSHKIQQPSMSIREIATSIGVSKTQANEFLHGVADIFPMLAPVLGLQSPLSRAQRNRRDNEHKEGASK